MRRQGVKIQGQGGRYRTGPGQRFVAALLACFLAMPPATLASLIMMVPVAAAATYADGYTKYQKGDFKSAERLLGEALKSGRASSADMAKTYKLLGICRFMLGNRSGASAAFKSGLKLNRNLSISPAEVLDDEVIGFFNGLKTGGGGAPAPAPAPTKAVASNAPKAAPGKAAPSAAVPSPTGAPKGGAARRKNVDSHGNPLKQTYLKVTSNIAAANVSIDGIIAGQVNNLINTSPGLVELEIAASGYISKKVRVNVVKDQETDITVNLEKPKPKPKPAPKPVPRQPIAKNQGNATSPMGGDGDMLGSDPAGANGATDGMAAGAAAGAVGGAAAGAALADQGAGAPMPKTAAKVKAAKRRGGNAKRAASEASLFGAETPPPSAGGAGRAKRNAGMAQARPQGPDLADQFEMDAAGGGYGAPAPYQAPPQYYSPPPQYYAPPPQYYAPPPPAYPAPSYAPDPAPPPPPDVPPPAGDPYGGSGREPSRNGSDSDGGGDNKNMFIAILPFGAGQFQNRSYILGVLFLGAEGGALYYWKTQSDQASQVLQTTNTYVHDNCYDPNASQTVADTCNQYIAQQQGLVDTAYKNSQYALMGFGALWGLGVIEALMAKPTKTVKKKAKQRRYNAFGEHRAAPRTPSLLAMDGSLLDAHATVDLDVQEIQDVQVDLDPDRDSMHRWIQNFEWHLTPLPQPSPGLSSDSAKPALPPSIAIKMSWSL